MSEAGGPSTQAGIFFQNSIAALYLGRMLDTRERAVRDRVLCVRVEAPADVDDIVVHHSDGSHRYIQAKLSLTLGSKAWKALWNDCWQQLSRENLQPDDHLSIILGSPSKLAKDLQSCCEVAANSLDAEEFFNRLTKDQKKIIAGIAQATEDAPSDPAQTKTLLARIEVEVFPSESIERDYAPLWMPESSTTADVLLGALRDQAGGKARLRAFFEPARLRATLLEKCEISIYEPSSWGNSSYRKVILDGAVIEVPGTSLVKPIKDAFLWPRARRYDRDQRPDFDDDNPESMFGVRPDSLDLTIFPSQGFSKVVVIGGPGFGKSVLSRAIAAACARQNLLPALVSIPELSRCDLEITEYLQQRVNSAFHIHINWGIAAEAGLLVLLLDGLDEISSDRRSVVLERIKNFSLRFPSVSWLLTVRDAAALTAPLDALLVELESLSREDISRLASLYRPDQPAFPEQLLQRLEGRPDLERLVRIPLFLALLLASAKSLDDLPQHRTELLESYLGLLFEPEQFKRGEQDDVDPGLVRTIVERVAFEALERDEIGVSSRLLRSAIEEMFGAATPTQPFIERLVKCGILRRLGPSQFQFPFPIVQEYLAACFILENKEKDLPERLPSVVKRPWAQAIQFALELHPNPNDLVHNLLSQEDDVFATNLRLLGRCVANGMILDAPLKEQIARRLGHVWPRMSWRTQTRVGSILCDAFTSPLVDEVRQCLSNRSLLHHGAGTIVARINDPDLTEQVLEELLEEEEYRPMHLDDLQIAVNEIAEKALALYAELARSSGESQDGRYATASLIGHLDGAKVSEASRLSVALDEQLPIPVRLAAFALGPSPLDQRALPLIEVALSVDEFHARHTAVAAIFKMDNPIPTIVSWLRGSRLSLKERLDIVGYILRSLMKTEQLQFFLAVLADPDIEEDLRQRLRVFAARFGDLPTMESLVGSMDILPVEIVGATAMIFGHHRHRSLAQTAYEKLESRDLSPDDRASLANAFSFGMTQLFHMDWFDGGTFEQAPLHPGADVIRPLLESWMAERDYSIIASLKLASDMSEFGSEAALNHLEHLVAAHACSEELDTNNHDDAHTIGSAIRTLRERRRLLPISFLEQVIEKWSYNAVSGAVDMIAAHGSREAFESLVSVYEQSEDYHLRHVALDAMETLAAQLGLQVKLREKRRLEVSTA